MGAAKAPADGAVAVASAPHPAGVLARGEAEPPQDQGGKNQQGDREGRRCGDDRGHGSGLRVDGAAGDEQQRSNTGKGEAMGSDQRGLGLRVSATGGTDGVRAEPRGGGNHANNADDCGKAGESGTDDAGTHESAGD